MDQEKQSLAISLAGGAVSAFLYFLAVRGGFFSFLISYTPLIPLFLVGLSAGPRAGGMATLFALFLGCFLTGLSGLVIYSALYAVPAVFFMHAALSQLSDPKRWYPIGGVLTGISLYAAAMVGVLIAVSMRDMVSVSEILPPLPPEGISPLMQQARDLILESPFLVFAMGVWIQVLAFYGLAIFANFMLKGWKCEIRDRLTLTPFMPSIMIFGAILVAGLLSFSSTLAIQIAGKTAFMILLLPYFLMGAARLHAWTRGWPNRLSWLFAVYMLTVLVFLPVFCFIGAGLYEQAKFLSNRYGSGTESESDK
ncbi:MAG: hypothetical protein P8P30_00785 [Rickettsiales bacterium]|nr:hypothetical protein [Rickettsiales bacterium]